VKLFELLFGCRHKSLTFPLTKRRSQRGPHAASLTGTYVVCVDCGKEFPYDWTKMAVVKDGRELRVVKAQQLRRAPAIEMAPERKARLR
jgi:hypothetical protein